MREVAVLAFLVQALGILPVSATQVTVYEALQPVYSDRGLVATGFSYACYGDTYNDPTLLVRLTAAESRLGGPDGFVNGNEAYRIGVQIHTAPVRADSRSLFQGLAGDTLEVLLDLTKLVEDSPSIFRGEVIEKTVECMRKNATRARSHQVRFLHIEVLGDSTQSRYSRIHQLGD